MSEEWEKLSSSYDELENYCPEGRVLGGYEGVLYRDLGQLYLDITVKAVRIITKLRVQAVSNPVSAP